MRRYPLKKLFRGGIAISLVLLTHCGQSDTYQGNGIWQKADGSTYQAPAPLNISRVQSSWGPKIRETIRSIEDSSVNSQGQTVILQKEAATIQLAFGVMVTLENGEQFTIYLSFVHWKQWLCLLCIRKCLPFLI